MQTNTGFFIEQVHFENGELKNLTAQPINKLDDAKRISEKFNVNTVAFFKVYPKLMIAHYDNNLKAVIVE